LYEALNDTCQLNKENHRILTMQYQNKTIQARPLRLLLTRS